MITTFQPMLDLEIEPTPAMLRGEQTVHQCSQCGTVVVRSSLAQTGPLGTCPACHVPADWWTEQLPVAGLAAKRGDSASRGGAA